MVRTDDGDRRSVAVVCCDFPSFYYGTFFEEIEISSVEIFFNLNRPNLDFFNFLSTATDDLSLFDKDGDRKIEGRQREKKSSTHRTTTNRTTTYRTTTHRTTTYGYNISLSAATDANAPTYYHCQKTQLLQPPFPLPPCHPARRINVSLSSTLA